MTSPVLRLVSAFILLFFAIHLPAQRISRVEPANWWVGMNSPELQLLVYGENIADLVPSTEYAGWRIEQVIRVENPNYLFLNIAIQPGAQPAEFDIVFKKDGRSLQSWPYRMLAREVIPRPVLGPKDVMYLITPDRFVNGDPANDEVQGMREGLNRRNPGGRHGGDIAGIINSLDYIDGMGFTALWLNPVLENDQPDYSYHGYACTDFYNIDARYGSNEDYRRLTALARERGIGMVMDMIMNHSGSEHWFVKDPPSADWINFGGQYTNTSHRRQTVQDIHAAEYDKRMFSDGWFVETMPDLNQRNPFMATYLIQNTIWWVEYLGLTGIRMDTYPYPDKDFMSDWTCAVLAEYPALFIVGEEWIDNPAIVSYWQRGKQNHDGYSSCLPSLMDFPLQVALSQALTQPEKQYGSGLVRLYEMLALDFLYADPEVLVIFPDNHDMDRFFTQVNEDPALAKMGLAAMATLRGVPQLYYGTEVLMANSKHRGDHGVIRSDFPGGWAGDKANAFTGQGLSTAQKEVQAYVRQLLNWRKTSRAIHEGRLMHFGPQDGVYVYFRYTGEDMVMVALNKGEQAAKLDFARYAEIAGKKSKAVDAMTGRAFDPQQGIEVPARSAAIIELY